MTAFICFEGITSVGKSRLVGLFRDHLTQHGYSVAVMGRLNTLSTIVSATRNPEVAFDKVQADYLANPLLQFVDPIVRSRLLTADVVLLDRFIYSPVAYHYDVLSAIFGDLDAILAMFQRLYRSGVPRPNVAVYLDEELEVVAQRYAERQDKAEPFDRHLEQQAREVFLEICRRDETLRLVRSNGRSLSQLFSEIMPAIMSVLPATAPRA